MGVVKNLMVRVGADLSGLASGFNKAGGATGNFKQKASKDIASLKNSLSQMKGAYTSISEATKDIDLTKSVSKQITEANKELGTLEKTAADLENKLAFWSEIEPAGMQYQTQALKESLAAVDAQTDSLYYKLQRLENVKSLGESVGIDNVTYSSLNKLQMNIASTEDEIRRMEGAAESASDATKNLGNSAKTAGSKVKAASGRIGDLRRNSKASALSVSDLTRSLRRVGVAAVGIKLAGAVLGEFRSLVTGYISQNETLQAKVDELKSSFGQALAPAINVATNALSKLMPYVLGISNAIGELITNLFGAGWTTVAAGAADAAAATRTATTAQNEYNRSLAGFDQITKLSSGNSSNAPGSTVTPVDIKLPGWLTDLPTHLKEAFSKGDYKGVGSALANALSAGLNQAEETEKSIGSTIAAVIQGSIDVASGFVEDMDWSSLGTVILTNVEDVVGGVDWNSIPRLTGAAIGGVLRAGWSIITGAVEDNIQKPAEESGKNVAWSVIKGVCDIVRDFQNWSSLRTPIREAISGAFGVEDIRRTIVEKITKAANDLSISFEAKLTTWKEALANKVIDFQARFTSWKDSMRDKIAIFKANLTTWRDSLKDKIVSFQARLTSWKDALVNKVVGFKANLTAWKDSLSSKIIDFQARLTSWKDSLLNKILDFKVNLQKGWSGSLADALGIDSITSKLDLKLPEISVDWAAKKTALGEISLPSFNVKWNAKGAILSGAQLFGRVGNTWLGGGEAGREAVLPLDRNTGWMDKIADRVAARVSSGGSGEQNLVVYLTLDGKVVTKTVIRNINAQAKATGKNPLAAYI